MNSIINRKILLRSYFLSFFICISSVVEVFLIVPVAISVNIYFDKPLSDFEQFITELMVFERFFLFDTFIQSTLTCVIIGGIISILSQFYFQYHVWSVHNLIINDFFQKYIGIGIWSDFKGNVSKFKKNIATECQNISLFLVGALCNIIGRCLFIIIFVSFTVIYFIEYINLSFLFLSILFFSLFLLVFYVSFKHFGDLREKSAIGIFKTLDEGFHNIPIIQVLRRSKFFTNRFIKHSNTFKNISIIHSFIPLLPRYIFELLVFIVIIFSIINNKLDYNYTYYLIFFLKIAPTVNIIIKNISDIGYGISSYKILSEKIITNKISKNNINLSFQELDFKCNYFDRKFVINFSKGEIILIKGPSGCGKTTLLESFLGSNPYYKIFLNEKPFDGFMSYNNVGFLPQDIYLINGNLKDNIALKNQYDERVLLDIISKLDLKLDPNRLLSTFGAGLSGGEKQRIGIARCLYAESDLIFMDEPTSALDDESSNYIINLLMKLKKDGKTFVIVTHCSMLDSISDKIIHLN